jgi:ureidoacrylate peracid hydrolase
VKKNNVGASLRRLITGARDSGVPVLFGPMAYTEEDCADEGLRRRSGINRLKFEARILAGSWGADFTPTCSRPRAR